MQLFNCLVIKYKRCYFIFLIIFIRYFNIVSITITNSINFQIKFQCITVTISIYCFFLFRISLEISFSICFRKRCRLIQEKNSIKIGCSSLDIFSTCFLKNIIINKNSIEFKVIKTVSIHCTYTISTGIT